MYYVLYYGNYFFQSKYFVSFCYACAKDFQKLAASGSGPATGFIPDVKEQAQHLCDWRVRSSCLLVRVAPVPRTGKI
jgi:hypothetical protein